MVKLKYCDNCAWEETQTSGRSYQQFLIPDMNSYQSSFSIRKIILRVQMGAM